MLLELLVHWSVASLDRPSWLEKRERKICGRRYYFCCVVTLYCRHGTVLAVTDSIREGFNLLIPWLLPTTTLL